MTELHFKVVIGDKLRDRFMHAADLFSNKKVLGELRTVVITVSEENINEEYLTKVQQNLLEAFDKTGIIVSFMDYIGRTKIPIYFRKDTQCISDGNGWGMFHKLLEELGYEVETDEYMVVTAVRHITLVPNRLGP